MSMLLGKFVFFNSPDALFIELEDIQVEKSFLQNEGGCRDGVKYEKGCQQEDASADNKNHTSIPTSFFIIIHLPLLTQPLLR